MNASHIPLSSSASKISSFTSGGLFDFTSHQNMSPSSRPSHHPSSSLVNSFPLSPSLGTNLSTEVRNVCSIAWVGSSKQLYSLQENVITQWSCDGIVLS